MWMGTILTQEQLSCIKDHRYNVTHWNPILDPYMQVFWRQLDKLTPRRVNCNVISVAGLALNFFSLVTLMYHSPTATEEAPSWAYVMAALSLVLYQALDALDGMQCRRSLTIEKWHVAELFDHTCDAVSTVSIGIQLAICMRIGDRPYLFMTLMLAILFMFYTAHWQTYVTGTVRFGTLDVTECQLSLCLGFLLTAVFGPDVWTIKVVVMEVREMIPFLTVAMTIVKFTNHVVYIWERGHKWTVAGTSVASPAVNIGIVFMLAIATKVFTNCFDYQPCVFLLVFGLIEAKQSYQLMIGYMSKSKVPFLDTIFLGPILLLANQLLGSPLSNHLLWVVMVYCAVDLLRYFSIVSLQLCRLTGVTCFSPYADVCKQNGTTH